MTDLCCQNGFSIHHRLSNHPPETFLPALHLAHHVGCIIEFFSKRFGHESGAGNEAVDTYFEEQQLNPQLHRID